MNIKTLYINDLNVKSLYINGKQVKIGGAEPELDCLCFTANTPGSTVKMEKTYFTPPSVNLQYSTNGSNWSPFTVCSNEQSDGTVITLANAGDKVWIKAIGQNERIGSNENNYNRFILTGSIAASGNVNSLLEEDEETARSMSLAGRTWAFCHLFYFCRSLTTPPELPATTLANDCYYRMFSYCSSLTTPPELPATTLANDCYYHMFWSCTSLTTPPELPATTLTERCYWCMFIGCSSLTSAPELPATTLAWRCYYRMFNGCSSLKISDTPVSGGVKFLDIPSGTGEASEWNDGMFQNTGGTYKSNPEVGHAYYYYT